MNTHENLLNVPSPYGGSFFTTTTVPYGGMPNSPFTKVRQPETTSSKNLFYDKVVEQAKIIYNLNQQVARLKKMITPGDDFSENGQNKEVARPQLTASPQAGQETNITEIENPKILIYGHSALDKADIIRIVKDKLLVSYNISLHNKDIKVLVSDQKNELKNLAPVDKLKSGNYDFFMAGPHPHSIKGKNIKHSWKTFAELKRIPTEVFESYHKKISKELLLEFASMIGDTWFENELRQVA